MGAGRPDHRAGRAHGLRREGDQQAGPPLQPVRYFDAVETEAFGQANIVAALRARLDELMPEPLADVLERQERSAPRWPSSYAS